MNLIKIFAVVALLFSSTFSRAQKTIGTVTSGRQEVGDVQSFSSGDTLMVTYVEKRDLAKNKRRLFYVTPNGPSPNFYIEEFPKAVFCGFENVRDRFYHYYVEKRKSGEFVLHALVGESLGAPSLSKEEIPVAGELIGFSSENGLQIYSRDLEKNSIKICRVRAMTIIGEAEFSLPDRFSFVNIKDFRIIGPSVGWIEEANSKVKIYPARDNFFLTLDHQSATEIHFFELNKKVARTISIPETKDATCNSFLRDSTLYRLSIFDKELSIKTYALGGGALKARYSYDLKRAKEEDERSTVTKQPLSNYQRLKELLRTSKNRGMPVIIVNKTSNDTYRITVASQPKPKGPTVFMPYGANPLGAILVIALSGASSAIFSEAPVRPSLDQFLNARLDRDGIDYTRGDTLFLKINRFFAGRRDLRFWDLVMKGRDDVYVVARNVRSDDFEIILFSREE